MEVLGTKLDTKHVLYNWKQIEGSCQVKGGSYQVLTEIAVLIGEVEANDFGEVYL